MDRQLAAAAVVQAGKQLIEAGLVVRTWGNVSCRVDQHNMAITPSGRSYDALTADQIVLLNMKTGRSGRTAEPSSEWKLHREIYQQRPEINFIIHTHQPFASAYSVTGLDITTASDQKALFRLGGAVTAVAYGPSGSKALLLNVRRALSRFAGKAYLLQGHGAVCLGRDQEEAFTVALTLEEICTQVIAEKTIQHDSESDRKFDSYYNSIRTEEGFILYLDPPDAKPFSATADQRLSICADFESGQLTRGPDAQSEAFRRSLTIHNYLYAHNEQLGAVIHTFNPDVVAISATEDLIKPYLDDFAQLIGTEIEAVDLHNTVTETELVLMRAKLEGRSALLLKSYGALCCGSDQAEALATENLLAKNCKAIQTARLFKSGKPLAKRLCQEMRSSYLTSYSKKARLD